MFKELDVVTLREAQPGVGLGVGAVGTVLEALRSGAFLVEFANDRGETIAMLTLNSAQLVAPSPAATPH